MKFKADIDIMPLEALLDPQGKAVSHNMSNIGLSQIDHVRIGKHITLEVEATDQNEAESLVDDACKKLLCNQVMESYAFKVAQA